MAAVRGAADEDVLSYALFPQVATEFFKYQSDAQENEGGRNRSRHRERSISGIIEMM